MVLSDLSIHRPVLATVMSLMVVLLGIMAYERLPVREGYSGSARVGGFTRCLVRLRLANVMVYKQ